MVGLPNNSPRCGMMWGQQNVCCPQNFNLLKINSVKNGSFRQVNLRRYLVVSPPASEGEILLCIPTTGARNLWRCKDIAGEKTAHEGDKGVTLLPPKIEE